MNGSELMGFAKPFRKLAKGDASPFYLLLIFPGVL